MKRGDLTNAKIYMCKQEVNIQTRAQNYGTSTFGSKGKDTSEPEMTDPLHIEKPSNEMMPHMQKGMIKQSIHNPN